MAYSMDLAGRVALVTGASGGLGAQFAKTLARAGAGVVLASRRMDKLKALRAEIEGEGGDAHVVEMDVTDAHSIRAAVAHAETEMGSIDILVNNSGVSTTQRLVDVTEEDFGFVFDTNVRGAFLWRKRWANACWRAPRGRPRQLHGRAHHQHRQHGGAESAAANRRVLHEQGRRGAHDQGHGIEWGKYGINVNAICPGYIDTEINHHHWQTEQGQKLVHMLPRKRIGSPADLDALLVMLASNESHFVNGAVIAADDGFGI